MLLYFKKYSKRGVKFWIFVRYIGFSFSSNFDRFFSLNWLLRAFSSMLMDFPYNSYGFWDKLKGVNKCQIPRCELSYFLSNFNDFLGVKYSSLWDELLLSKYSFFMEGRLNGTQIPKFGIYGRYAQFSFSSNFDLYEASIVFFFAFSFIP